MRITYCFAAVRQLWQSDERIAKISGDTVD
jgi:hypothetical protein